MTEFKFSIVIPSISFQVKRLSGALNPAYKAHSDDKLLARKAEKAEKVMHLICWGPS
uniref:Uncharacterized protein n=1 Tax=Nelumbo nucifera TaxID=4432 RepID=A0A822XRM6_NELNU|nr:TPA_asm: hypothetical protein HUJ06_024543 [Nelumbo nucifera]